MTNVISEVSARSTAEPPPTPRDDERCGQGEPLRVAGWRPVAETAGRALIVLGVVVLAFFAFQLWGTGLLESQAQEDLAGELERAIAEHRGRLAVRESEASRQGGGAAGELSTGRAETDTSGGEVEGDDSVATDLHIVPLRSRPEPGSAVARIEAPTIGLDKTVVEGVGRPQLRNGPGLYPISPLPGHSGNVAIAGHRTTHGSPFADLDQLLPGDSITLETLDGLFTYRVEAQYDSDGEAVGHRIVSPEAVEVISDRGDNRLTLTSCHPRYSDRQRLVVTAVLDGSAVAFPEQVPLPGSQTTLVEGLDLHAQLAATPSADGSSSGGPAGGTAAPPIAETGLDEPLGWQLDRLDEALLWVCISLAAGMLIATLFRRKYRIVAALFAPIILIYPLVVSLILIDAMAPAW